MQAQAELDRTDAHEVSRLRQLPWNRMLVLAGLIVAALFFLTSLTGYVVDFATHRGGLLSWYDLNVYNDAGLITRQLPSILYSWQLTVGIKFTYTPFAAILFAGGSLVPWATLRWLMTVASLISVPLIVWLTLGGMGRRGISRASVTLAVSAVVLWTEPVVRALLLGQIEPLLLLLVVWDLTRSDQRWWKGAGIGIAAGIKLVPLIFIPYLLLAGKIRQAVVATCTLAITVVIGFIFLPGPSRTWWLTGYFIRPGRTGAVDALVNQSLLGLLARQIGGGMAATGPVWLPIAIVVALIGIAGGAVLSRAGKTVQSWTLVGITSVLVSPISWDHHWVWIVPFIAMLAGMAMTTRRWARWGFLVATIATAVVFGSWPRRYSGPDAFVPGHGFLGWFVQPPQIYAVTTLHGFQLLTFNLFVVAGCVIFLAMLAWAWRSWRMSRPKVSAAPPPVAAAQPKAPNATDALLARADAVLNADSPTSSPAAESSTTQPTHR